MFKAILCCAVLSTGLAAKKDKPHHHTGVLQAYDGKQISYDLTNDQKKKLEIGQPIIINEAKGKSGRGFVLQDIEAPGDVCMSKIMDLANYHKMVPHVRSIEIYEEEKFENGTIRYGAKFNVGVVGMRFGYFLKLTHEPKYMTFTWTLDFKHTSDFDDTVGHWQVMAHPTKRGWSRVLYSTQLKLPTWVPGIIVNFLTNTALVEATGWVRKESEALMKKSGGKTSSISGGATAFAAAADATVTCYSEDEAGAHYDSACFLKSTITLSPPTESSVPATGGDEGTEVEDVVPELQEGGVVVDGASTAQEVEANSENEL
eukprot:gene5185-10369_t